MSYTRDGISRERAQDTLDANYVRKVMYDKFKAFAESSGTDRTAVAVASERGGYHVYVMPEMAQGAAYTDAQSMSIALHPLTWRTLAHSEDAVEELFLSCAGTSGIRFLVMDVGPYAVAARREAAAMPIVTTASDLDTLMADAQRLLVQASGLSGRPTQLQTNLFIDNLNDLRQRYARIDEAMAKTRAVIDLAEEAVIGATT